MKHSNKYPQYIKLIFFTVFLSFIFNINQTIATPFSPGEKLTYECKTRYYENWIFDSDHNVNNEVKWKISGTRFNYEGGYYISSLNGSKVHGLFKVIKTDSDAEEIKIEYEEKLDKFLDQLVLKSVIQGEFTAYVGDNFAPGIIWMRINGQKIQKTILGSDELTEIIVKVKRDGNKQTMRTKYSKKHNRIFEFQGNDPLKYKCILIKIEK